MELRQIRYFAAVARRRHFTAAAEAIGVAQPALSQQIRLLERELGVALFDRSGRRVRLTAAGEAFLIRAERIEAEVASAKEELTAFQKNKIFQKFEIEDAKTGDGTICGQGSRTN